MSSDKELEEIRKRNLSNMQQRSSGGEQIDREQEQIDLQKQAMLRKILSSKARQRLGNIKMVKPEFASRLEVQLIQIAQQGRISLPLDDKQLKDILRKLQSGRREIRIRRI